ncbi:hypothetical protein L7F22_049434 [Adiantum nelumboides]|nr:hypothetical protein [Adiantum nelumboides]
MDQRITEMPTDRDTVAPDVPLIFLVIEEYAGLSKRVQVRHDIHVSSTPTTLDRDELRAEISHLVFKDGQRLPVSSGGVTVIVGPNNAGKTVLLREIAQIASWLPQNGPQHGLMTLERLELNKSGSFEELLSWLHKNGVRSRVPDIDPETNTTYYAANAQSIKYQLRSGWSHSDSFGEASSFVLSHQTTDQRLQLVNGVGVHNMESEEPANPLQILFDDKGKEQDLNRLIGRAFGFEVSINRYISNIDLKVGRPTMPDVVPPASRELLREYSSLRSITEQGDGVRSFAGLLLHLLVPRYRITLVDEPEAFLHPPQARLLAKYLVELSPKGSQLIVRLTRPVSGSSSPAFLSPELVKDLSADTFLQNSNVLNGLFHDAVVLGESDADCQFYRAVADWKYRDYRAPDLQYVQVAGKTRIAGVLQKLIKLGVPAAAIVDFDILNDAAVLEKLVLACGGSWEQVAVDYSTLASSIEAPSGPSVASVRSVVDQVLAGRGGSSRLTEADVASLREATRFASGWRVLKKTGQHGVEQGPPQVALNRIVNYLAGIGVFVVPVGELERWHATVNGKSGEWVAAVLEAGLHRQLHSERDLFVGRVVSYIASRSGRSLHPVEPISDLTERGQSFAARQ